MGLTSDYDPENASLPLLQRLLGRCVNPIYHTICPATITVLLFRALNVIISALCEKFFYASGVKMTLWFVAGTVVLEAASVTWTSSRQQTPRAPDKPEWSVALAWTKSAV